MEVKSHRKVILRYAEAAMEALICVLSYVVFAILDVLDPILCVVYKCLDYVFDSQCRPCYCYCDRAAIAGDGELVRSRIVVDSADSDAGGAMVCHCVTEYRSAQISQTLFARKSVVRDVLRMLWKGVVARPLPPPMAASSAAKFRVKEDEVVEVASSDKEVCWSDCACGTCNSWQMRPKESLFVRIQGASTATGVDVLFIHGFISCSRFWTETLFPVLEQEQQQQQQQQKRGGRLIAVDLLGFGRSPKPSDCMYTLEDHVEMLITGVLRAHNVQRFHVVAHSLGCILALALASRFPSQVLSLTLVAPPYFDTPDEISCSSSCSSSSSSSQQWQEEEQRRRRRRTGEYVLRQLAPRRIWPPMALGASVASWYEHVSRCICALVCRQHRVWERCFVGLTRGRVKTYLLEGFMCHTHRSAWHTLHNVLCGGAAGPAADAVVARVRHIRIHIFHGARDEVVPTSCSVALARRLRLPRGRLRILPRDDHLSIVVARAPAFAAELAGIWRHAHAQAQAQDEA